MMYRWVTSLSDEEREEWFKYVATDLKEGGKIFGTKIVKTVNLADFKTAITES